MKRFFCLVALVLVPACACAQPAANPSQAWPTRPIHLIVPFPPGSSPDLIARLLADKLSPTLGQPVIVENRPGAGGNIGTGLVAKAAPDGYTLGLSIQGPLAVNPSLYRKMDYDPFRDLAPVTAVAMSPNVLVVDAKLGVNAVREFVALAKTQPGKLNYGSVGNGSASHLAMELFKESAGVEIVHVPYPGAPQVTTAMLNGQIAAAFVVPAIAMPLARSGRLTALAVTSSARSPLLPELPTLAESDYPAVIAIAWNAIVAPAKTPQAVVERLNRELVAILKSEELRAKLAGLYFEPAATSPEGLAELMRAEAGRWEGVIRKTGASAD